MVKLEEAWTRACMMPGPLGLDIAGSAEELEPPDDTERSLTLTATRSEAWVGNYDRRHACEVFGVPYQGGWW